MASITAINDSLNSIVAASSIQYADLAAGNSDGPLVRFRWTGPSLPRQTTHDSGSTAFENIDDRRYLIASITKPVVSLIAVQLAAEGRLSLNEPVRDFVEGFHRGQLRGITIRHLLTHTSGLPDMLPNNNDLRAAHSPLSEFVRHTAKVTPDFLPGTDCRYSSMGIAVLSLIMERLTDVSIRDLIAERLFRPLQMTGSWLGLPVDQADQLMPTVVPSELPPTQQADSDWNWNSRYWRCLGAPWGGMISTVEDLGRLAVMLLNQGCTMSGKEVLNPSVISASTKNQTRHMTGLSETDRRHRPWGLGWRLNWPDHATVFSDFLPFKAYGHWGATGTVMWIDPQSRRWCVILTNQPYEQSQSVLQRMSNVIATDDSYVT